MPMNAPLRAALAVCMFLAGLLPGYAQQHCGTMDLLQRLSPEQRRYLPGGDVFESRFAAYKAARAFSRADTLCDSGTVFRIPVVFHVIHNGEAYGVGANIPDERFYEQIRILNEDYRRKPGTPGFTTDTRSADAMIEFVLATRDPQCQATTGITRTNGGRATWDLADNDIFKNLVVWPTNQFLNIWVLNLQGYLGYASFPETSLPLGGSVSYSHPDGVVANYKYVGNSPPNFTRLYAGGRTITHEVGHFFGLIHTWGDGDCSATDFCDDTPPQNGVLMRCPSTPADTASLHCPGYPPILYQNYMQYVYDSCMHIFTRDQVYRMRYVLCHTPARDSLRISCGLTAVEPADPNLSHLATIINNGSADQDAMLRFNDSGAVTISIFSIEGRELGTYGGIVASGQLQKLNFDALYAPGLYGVWVTQNGRKELIRLMVSSSISR